MLNEYNATNSQIGDRGFVVSYSKEGQMRYLHATESNNTACCYVCAESNSPDNGSIYKECNFVGNKKTSSSLSEFIHAHISSLQFSGFVAIGNNHQVLSGSFGSVRIDVTECHFCSNGFPVPVNGRSCISTYKLSVPGVNHCVSTRNFSLNDETILLSNCLCIFFSLYAFIW